MDVVPYPSVPCSLSPPPSTCLSSVGMSESKVPWTPVLTVHRTKKVFRILVPIILQTGFGGRLQEEQQGQNTYIGVDFGHRKGHTGRRRRQ